VTEDGTRVPTLTVRRIIDGTPEEIFDLWTDPRSMALWMSPYPGRVHSEVTADVRPGGEYRLVMSDGETTCEIVGKYVEVQRPLRLVFTWRGAPTGNAETLVTLALRPVGGGTELTLTHERLPSDESRSGHAQGWTNFLDHLAAHGARTL
jgi:uncharacterized protein YndB with AHSA1/START domain